MSTAIDRALNIAQKAHQGQFDKGGKPYINHPLAVAEFVQTENEKIVALLHDVVEDSDITLHDLELEGFSEEILLAIACLTHKSGQTYDEYLFSVKSNTLARAVKLADLKHNSDISRIASPAAKDFNRLKKYQNAICFLMGQEKTE